MPQFRLLGDVMFLVPFDGSELAEAALVRATQFGVVLEERVLAVSVIPKGNADYARERGWIGPGEPFDATAVVSGLHERVTELCPSADFRHEVVDRYAPAGTISQRLRRVARGRRWCSRQRERRSPRHLPRQRRRDPRVRRRLRRGHRQETNAGEDREVRERARRDPRSDSFPPE